MYLSVCGVANSTQKSKLQNQNRSSMFDIWYLFFFIEYSINLSNTYGRKFVKKQLRSILMGNNGQ